MKIKLLFLLLLNAIFGCNNNNSSSLLDSTSNQISSTKQSNKMAFSVDTNIAGATIISTDEYEKINQVLQNCKEVSSKEIFYINLAMQRAKRFDEIDSEAIAYNQYTLKKNHF